VRQWPLTAPQRDRRRRGARPRRGRWGLVLRLVATRGHPRPLRVAADASRRCAKRAVSRCHRDPRRAPYPKRIPPSILSAADSAPHCAPRRRHGGHGLPQPPRRSAAGVPFLPHRVCFQSEVRTRAAPLAAAQRPTAPDRRRSRRVRRRPRVCKGRPAAARGTARGGRPCTRHRAPRIDDSLPTAPPPPPRHPAALPPQRPRRSFAAAAAARGRDDRARARGAATVALACPRGGRGGTRLGRGSWGEGCRPTLPIGRQKVAAGGGAEEPPAPARARTRRGHPPGALPPPSVPPSRHDLTDR